MFSYNIGFLEHFLQKIKCPLIKVAKFRKKTPITFFSSKDNLFPYQNGKIWA